MPTVRNARGSDLIVTNDDETIYFSVQSKALSKRVPVPLGLSLDRLRSDWWIITINANSHRPACYIMRLEEVCAHAFRSRDEGAYWLQPPGYDRDEFREAWHRLETD